MPRKRLLAQIDDELLQARESLRFWRDQTILLDQTEFQIAAKRQVMHREAEIQRLLEAHEMICELGRANLSETSASPQTRNSSLTSGQGGSLS